MRKALKKHKIITRGKSYSLKDSPLFNISSKRKLLKVIAFDDPSIKEIKASIGNYSIFTQMKGSKSRIIEKPIGDLDKLQSRIASLLCRIEVPDFMHSGVKRKSHVSNARSHLNSEKTFTTDIKSFFPSTSECMVFNFFYKTMKCAPDVADLLAKLCTCDGHIPTGSRISMPLSYWANHRMFAEMEALSRRLDVTMTLYVDDLTFSGSAVNLLFVKMIKSIASRHQHVLHPKKSVLYSPNVTKVVTGVVIRNGLIYVKNEQHKRMYQDIEQMKAFRGKLRPPASLLNRTLGRINSMSVIDRRYKDKARSLVRLIKGD